MNEKLEPIANFLLSEESSQKFFETIIGLVISHELKNIPGIVIPFSGRRISEKLLSLSDKDSFTLNGHVINGKKVRELFVVTILLKYLCVSPNFFNKLITIAIPYKGKEEFYDVSIIVTDKNDGVSYGNGEYHFKDNADRYDFQIKSIVDYQVQEENGILKPKGFPLEKIKSYLAKYSDSKNIFFLIYNETLTAYSTDESEEFLKENPNVFYVSNLFEMRDEKNEKIKLNKDKINFLLLHEKVKATVCFGL